MKIKLTKEQVKHLKAIEWLISDKRVLEKVFF